MFDIKILITYIVVNEMEKMGRKERCPQCGSKKFSMNANQKKCKICKFIWTGKIGGKTTKKDKVRF
jgi:hypothetical protein